MLNFISLSLDTKKFITQYPGYTEEEKEFMQIIKKKFTEREEKVRSYTTISTFFILAAYISYEMKQSISQKTLKKYVFMFPMFFIAATEISSVFNLCCSLSEYKSELINSPAKSKYLELIKYSP